MKPVVTVVDYGMGNLLSVTRALEHCGAEVVLESSPQRIMQAERLVLPGVGAFVDGMSELRQRQLIEPIRDYAISAKPLLGICLGMQMMLDGSDEFGESRGLGIVPGWVRKLPTQPGIKLPHIGWSAISPPPGADWQGSLLQDVPVGHEMYFVHSYHAEPTNPAHRLAETRYGEYAFCAAIRKGNVTGCQFHPEKSGETGLNIIRRFLQAGV